MIAMFFLYLFCSIAIFSYLCHLKRIVDLIGNKREYIMKSRKLLLSLAVFFLVGAFAPMKASPVVATDGENDEPEAKGWVSIGPDNVAGRVRAIVFDKFNDGVMYAGSVGGGLFVSVNGGNNWREIDFSNGQCFAVSSIAQGEDGTIYVGTGEGFYQELFIGQNNRKSGLPGNGVYKVTTGNAQWAASLTSDEEKYAYVANNFASELIPGTQPATRYDLTNDFSFVNDLAWANGKLYIATKYGGLKIWDGNNLTAASIDGATAVNVTDIKVNREGKIAIAYNQGTSFAVARLSNEQGTEFSPITFSTQGNEEAFGRIELAFGIKNNNVLYALVATANNGSLKGVYKVDLTSDNVRFGNKMTSNTMNLGYNMDEAMSIAINDMEQEYIYIAGNTLQRLFDANGADVFYSETQTSPYATLTSGSYVAPNIHSILFKENPQTAEDSTRIYLSTDAGIFVYALDATQSRSWRPANKGLVSAQYYNVAVGADGSVMGAAQSNAINYIAAPSVEKQKSADIVWSPNSKGFEDFSEDMSVWEEKGDFVNFAYNIEAKTGANAVSSAVHRTKPNIRKPFVLLRPYNSLTRTYSNDNDYEEVNSQTWQFGQGHNGGKSGLMLKEMSGYGSGARFISPMTLWETFNAPDASRDSVDFTFAVTSSNDAMGATRIFRGEEVIRFVAGTELKDGDKILVESNSLEYPFFYTLTADRFGATGGVLDFAPIEDTTIKVPNPIQSRLFIGTSKGVYVCKEIMNFKKVNTERSSSVPLSSELIWVSLYDLATRDANYAYLNPVRAVAASSDGDALLIAVEHTSSNTSDLIRISGINNILSNNEVYSNTSTNHKSFTCDTLATFNRFISSIAYEPGSSDVAYITFSGFDNTANVKKISNVSGDVANIQTADLLVGEEDSPAYTILLDAFSTKAYVGTDRGLYETSNRNASTPSWSKVAGIPNVPIYDLYQQTANLPTLTYTTYLSNNATENVFEGTKYSGAIYAASYGKGLFMNRDNLQTPQDPVNVGLDEVKVNGEASINLYPNPAANSTTLNYNLEVASKVVMNIYDMNGRLISTLDKGTQSAGSHSQIIDLHSMDKGVYMIQMLTKGSVKTVKLVVQ